MKDTRFYISSLEEGIEKVALDRIKQEFKNVVIC